MIIIFILLFGACSMILVHCLNMFKHMLTTVFREGLSSALETPTDQAVGGELGPTVLVSQSPPRATPVSGLAHLSDLRVCSLPLDGTS